MSKDHHIVPVWFFVGVLLLIYGVLILGTGMVQFSSPPQVVLAHLHAPIWWGAILIAIGAVYVYLFRPGRS